MALAEAGGVPDRGEAYTPEFRQAADHVKHDSLLPGEVEVQAVPRRDIEEVVYG